MGILHEDPFNENIKKPTQFQYIRCVSFILRTISSWPGRRLGEKQRCFEGVAYDYYITTLSIIYLISGLWYLKENIEHLAFLELGHIYIVLLLNILATSRAFTLCLSEKYRTVATTFLTKIHLFYHKSKSKYARKIYAQVHRFSEIFSMYVTGAIFITIILFVATPVYINYSQGKYESTEDLVNTTYMHPCYFKFPFNAHSNFKGYLVGTAINWYGAYLCGTCVNMFDLFLSLMVFNLWGHFKILINILSEFPQPASLTAAKNAGPKRFTISDIIYSDSEQVQINTKLKECIIYHREISDFTNDMSEAFGMSLLMFYMFHQVAGCLLLLECSQLSPDAVFQYVPLTVIMFTQLIQTSIIFETIGTMSEKLKDAVYYVPWEYFNKNNRVTFLLFYLKVQEPIHVKAGGMIDVGVTTMASIIRASFSYFAFLRTFSVE